MNILNKNDVIKVDSVNGNNIVLSSTLLPSDFKVASEMIGIYDKVITKESPNANPLYDVVVLKNKDTIIGKYDNIEVIKLIRLSSKNWIVGASSALPINIHIARGYVNAMKRAVDVLNEIDVEPVSEKIIKKDSVKTVKETFINGEMVKITGMIKGIDAVTAVKEKSGWVFNVEKKGADYSWMICLYELTLKIKEIIGDKN